MVGDFCHNCWLKSNTETQVVDQESERMYVCFPTALSEFDKSDCTLDSQSVEYWV